MDLTMMDRKWLNIRNDTSYMEHTNYAKTWKKEKMEEIGKVRVDVVTVQEIHWQGQEK
jgi:hypothetical protein